MSSDEEKKLTELSSKKHMSKSNKDFFVPKKWLTLTPIQMSSGIKFIDQDNSIYDDRGKFQCCEKKQRKTRRKKK